MFYFINTFKWYDNGLGEDNEITMITTQWKVIYKHQEIHKETVATWSPTFVIDTMRQSFIWAPVQTTTYLLGQEGNDLRTYSIQPLDNFCLQVTRRKKFNYINSQMQWSPMNTEDTFAWLVVFFFFFFFFTSLVTLWPGQIIKNDKSIWTPIQQYLGR